MNEKRDLETIVREIDARQQIHDCIMRYCRGVDHADPDLALSAYHPDATDEHGAFKGRATDFVAANPEMVRDFDILDHLICNEYVEFDEDDPSLARAETKVIGVLLKPEEDGYLLSATSCRYLDKFEERDGLWRIAERRVVLDWEAEGPALGLTGSPKSTGMLRGFLNTSDPSFGHGFKLWGDTVRLPVSEVRVGASGV